MYKVSSLNGPVLLDEQNISVTEGYCMSGFNTYKDKRYWILFFPFLVILLGVSFFASNYFAENPLMIVVFLLLFAISFWGTYYLWKYVGDKKRRDS